MRRILALMLCLCMVLCFGACAVESVENNENPVSEKNDDAQPEITDSPATDAPEREVVRLGGLTGPTTMGMVKLLADNEEGLTENEYEFTLAGSADELTPRFIQGELDIISVPVNLGSVLYNKTGGDVQMLCVNTLGVLYVLEKGGEGVSGLGDLAGKTIYATGKGSTPEYTLAYLLEQQGLKLGEDVQVEWKSEPGEIVAQLAAMESAVCMLPQPYVTVAMSKVEGLEIRLDLTEEWDKLGTGTRLITSGIFVRKGFAEEHPEAVEKFLREFEASVLYVNEHVEEGAELVEKYISVKSPVARAAIPYCHMVCLRGADMVESTESFLTILLGQKPEAVGGSVPGADFYYGG